MRETYFYVNRSVKNVVKLVTDQNQQNMHQSAINKKCVIFMIKKVDGENKA